MFPRIDTRGTPFECGRQYGSAARDLIHANLGAYERLTAYYLEESWPAVVARAQRYLPAIEAFSPDAAAEMHGIATGAGVGAGDVVALNCRSELMFGDGSRTRVPQECSTIVVPSCSSDTGRTILAQNWDWSPLVRDGVVIVRSISSSGAQRVNLVEAGLLAKTGLSDSGVAVCTNSLIGGPPDPSGVPYHVLLYALARAGSVGDAIALLTRTTRAIPANYTIADSTGATANIETLPGRGPSTFAITPGTDGVFWHTNHFMVLKPRTGDIGLSMWPDSARRSATLAEALTTDRPLGIDAVKSALADHTNHPDGVCSHSSRSRSAPEEDGTTLASVIYEPQNRSMLVAHGHPCLAAFTMIPVAAQPPDALTGRQRR